MKNTDWRSHQNPRSPLRSVDLKGFFSLHESNESRGHIFPCSQNWKWTKKLEKTSGWAWDFLSEIFCYWHQNGRRKWGRRPDHWQGALTKRWPGWTKMVFPRMPQRVNSCFETSPPSILLFSNSTYVFDPLSRMHCTNDQGIRVDFSLSRWVHIERLQYKNCFLVHSTTECRYFIFGVHAWATHFIREIDKLAKVREVATRCGFQLPGVAVST